MDRFTQGLLVLACVVGIAAGGLYLYKNVSVGCVDLYFYKTCGIATKSL